MFFSHEMPFAALPPLAVDPTVGQMALEAEKMDPSPPPPPPTPEQLRAVEEVFAAEEESDVVAGMVGMWTATMLLQNLALDHFTPPAGELEEDEIEREKRRRKRA